MFKTTLLALTFTLTTVITSTCPNDQMTLNAWFGDEEMCSGIPTLENFTVTIDECSFVEGGDLPFFVYTTYTGSVYNLMLYLADPDCADLPVAILPDFVGQCRLQDSEIGYVAIRETKIDDMYPCNTPYNNTAFFTEPTCTYIQVDFFEGAGCNDSSKITPEGGVAMDLGMVCTKVSTGDSDRELYATVIVANRVGFGVLYSEEMCDNSEVSTFMEFDASAPGCIEYNNGEKSSMRILGEQTTRPCDKKTIDTD